MAILSANNLRKLGELGAIKEMRRFRSGQINESYYLKTNQGEYVLRMYRYKKEKEIAFEIALLSALKGCLVPEIIPVNGKEISTIGSHFAIVYAYIPGKSLKNITPSQRKSVGKELAKIHSKTKGFKWPGKRNEYYNFTNNKINLFSRTVAKSRIPLKKRFQEIKDDIIKYRLSSSLPSGGIHVDIKPENVLFYKGRLNGIIDFDNSYIGPLVLDLAKTMMWFGLHDKKMNLTYARDIYRGYESARKLTALECKELYKAIMLAYATHLFDVFYMASLKKNTMRYFRFLMNNLYSSYKNFTVSKQDFYEYIA